jgi:hypothetical protein
MIPLYARTYVSANAFTEKLSVRPEGNRTTNNLISFTLNTVDYSHCKNKRQIYLIDPTGAMVIIKFYFNSQIGYNPALLTLIGFTNRQPRPNSLRQWSPQNDRSAFWVGRDP